MDGLTQTEADALINMPKKKVGSRSYKFPSPGNFISIPVVSFDGKESFLIDCNRAQIRLTKCTYQERYRTIDILVRLDIDGPPHTNPYADPIPLPYLTPYNGKIIDCPHLHLYVEGYDDKWAIPCPTENFSDTSDLFNTLIEFFDYCNINQNPKIITMSLTGFGKSSDGM